MVTKSDTIVNEKVTTREVVELLMKTVACWTCARRAKGGRRISLSLHPRYIGAMAAFLSHWLVPIAIGAVAVVLLLGLINMMRGGSGNTSQKLMRLRVLLQFIAIIVIMFTIWVMAR